MLRCIVSDDPSSGPLCERYQLKLHDLEYALEYSRTSPGDGLVGTVDFLAVEVAERTYKFAPKSLDNRRSNINFHRNFLHDLESLAWIALDFATIHVPRQKLLSEAWQDLQPLLENMWQRHCALFPNQVGSWTDRVNLFVEPKSRKELTKMLQQVYGEDSPLSRLPDIFSALRDAYTAVESRLSSAGTRLPASAFNAHAGIYDVFRRAFREISDYYAAEEGQGPLVSIRHIDWTNGKIYAHRDIKPVAKVAPKAKKVETRAKTGKSAAKKRKASEGAAVNLRRSKRSRKTTS